MICKLFYQDIEQTIVHPEKSHISKGMILSIIDETECYKDATIAVIQITSENWRNTPEIPQNSYVIYSDDYRNTTYFLANGWENPKYEDSDALTWSMKSLETDSKVHHVVVTFIVPVNPVVGDTILDSDYNIMLPRVDCYIEPEIPEPVQQQSHQISDIDYLIKKSEDAALHAIAEKKRNDDIKLNLERLKYAASELKNLGVVVKITFE
jgi:hypothetical protein